jgi:hypothetical protein
MVGPSTLKHKNRITEAVSTHFIKCNKKYGIQVPRSIEEAYQLDQESGTDFWHQGILREMKNNVVAFKFLEDGNSIPGGSMQIPCHTVFNVKVDLKCKVCYVARGHWTAAHTQSTYIYVITRESVCIASLLAALNDLEMLAVTLATHIYRRSRIWKINNRTKYIY